LKSLGSKKRESGTILGRIDGREKKKKGHKKKRFGSASAKIDGEEKKRGELQKSKRGSSKASNGKFCRKTLRLKDVEMGSWHQVYGTRNATKWENDLKRANLDHRENSRYMSGSV